MSDPTSCLQPRIATVGFLYSVRFAITVGKLDGTFDWIPKSPMAESIKPLHRLPNCPVCGTPMELLSRHHDYVAIHCSDCRISLTVPTVDWEAVKDERRDGPRKQVG